MEFRLCQQNVCNERLSRDIKREGGGSRNVVVDPKEFSMQLRFQSGILYGSGQTVFFVPFKIVFAGVCVNKEALKNMFIKNVSCRHFLVFSQSFMETFPFVPHFEFLLTEKTSRITVELTATKRENKPVFNVAMR